MIHPIIKNRGILTKVIRCQCIYFFGESVLVYQSGLTNNVETLKRVSHLNRLDFRIKCRN